VPADDSLPAETTSRPTDAESVPPRVSGTRRNEVHARRAGEYTWKASKFVPASRPAIA
jgi:hypothetical protein